MIVDLQSPQQKDINCDSVVKYKIYLHHPTQSYFSSPTTKPTTIFTKTETTYDSTEKYTMQNNVHPSRSTTPLPTALSKSFPSFPNFRLHNITKKTSIVLNRMKLYSNLNYAVTFVNNAHLESPPAFNMFIGSESVFYCYEGVIR